LEALAEKKKTLRIKPELEVFDVEMIDTCQRYLEKGLLKAPLHFQFVLGAPGEIPANVKSLLHFSEIIPSDSTWSAGGIGAGQFSVAMVAVVMGGHVWVGLEDNIYYSKGVLAKNNAELVERVVRIAREFGREVATPQEARRILSLM
jgi:3-keto-5-aminohexanoate cleavage enzyme